MATGKGKSTPSVQGRPRKEAQRNLRREFMEGALALVGELGMAGFTIRELARRLKVSHNAHTRHFVDKATLFAAIAVEGQRELDQYMRRAASIEAPPLVKLQLAGRAYVTFALHNPAHYSIMFDHPYPYGTFPELDTVALGTFDTMVQLVAQCQADGLMLPGPVRQHTSVCWAAAHGIAKLLITGRYHFETAAEKQAFADFAIANLLGHWPFPASPSEIPETAPAKASRPNRSRKSLHA